MLFRMPVGCPKREPLGTVEQVFIPPQYQSTVGDTNNYNVEDNQKTLIAMLVVVIVIVWQTPF